MRDREEMKLVKIEWEGGGVNCALLLGCMVYKYTDLGNLTTLTKVM